MSEGKITFAINANQTRKNHPQIDGMIALKKIENYSYALTDEIGLGYSSHVYKGKNDLTNELVAIKAIDIKKEDELNRQFINQEIAVLEKIKAKHTINLLKLFDVLKTKNNLYIITEFCEGKDIAKILRKKKVFSQIQAQSIMKQLLQGYDELYQLGVVHRDLKLANIFIKKGVLKLADFGFAISSEQCHEKFEYNVGSPYYMPPESLKFNRYSFKSDVWSIGVIAFQLLFGKLPWKEKVEAVLFEKITNTPVEELFDPEVSMSDQYRDFIIKCLQIDYEKRASPEFIINYEWHKAMDYVEGFNEIDICKPLSMIKIMSCPSPSVTAKQLFTTQVIDEENSKGIRKYMIAKQNSNNVRDKSPSNRGEFGRQMSNIQNPFMPKPAIVKQRQQITEAISPNNDDKNNQIQHTILGQIHYCRFLSTLYDLIAQNNYLPEGYLLRSQLCWKISIKFDGLLRLAAGDNNLFKFEGFAMYSLQQRWKQLKAVIQKYDRKFKNKFQHEVNRNLENSDQVLANSIKYLASNIQLNYKILEQLTYFYQLRDLEKRQNAHNFALSSKIELLASRKPSSIPEKPSQLNCERLSNKLSLMNI